MAGALAIVLFAQLSFYFLQKNGFREFRESLLKSALVLAAIVSFGTEFLSIFTALKPAPVMAFWIAANFVTGIFVFRRTRLERDKAAAGASRIANDMAGWLTGRETAPFLLVSSIIFAVVLVTALYAPPNTSDSMTYHMARVAHWIQQSSVDFYPTSILRQLYQNPLAEYAIMHVQLLAGDDRYANLVQFACFVLCAAAVSLTCKRFDLNRGIQALSVVILATIPMGVLQGSSTQNDLVVSLFTLCFLVFFLKFAADGDNGAVVYAGLALGAALLSKGTAYPFCFAIGAIVFGGYFFAKNWEGGKLRFASRTVVVGAIALIFLLPHYARNWQTFGSPVTSGDDTVSNRNLSAAMIGANLYRNYFVHFGTFSNSFNSAIEDAGKRLLGDEMENPDSTYLERPFMVSFSVHEDSAGNLLHLLLITLSLPFAFFSRRAGEKKLLAVTAFTVLSGSLIFCIILKWQPWAGRLHLSLFIMSVPLIAAMLSRLGDRLALLVAVLCVFASLPFLLAGEPRSLIPTGSGSVLTSDRTELYFANRKELAATCFEIGRILRERGATDVGLHLSNEYQIYQFGDWEYALWLASKAEFAGEPRIRHVGVENVSSHLASHDPPEWVISARPEDMIEGAHYAEVWKSTPFRLLQRDDLPVRKISR